eukprot:TRINITY_DN25410_c0_g1_i1.p1 TRINITY_DN25410_c0_g1~~TRINITY_DN25410_c0_g1_i1.p1  ORF type:complete len:297 (+),score=29.69 TRINITY_DN25410_c0_g1_i1:104-892(+)
MDVLLHTLDGWRGPKAASLMTGIRPYALANKSADALNPALRVKPNWAVFANNRYVSDSGRGTVYERYLKGTDGSDRYNPYIEKISHRQWAFQPGSGPRRVVGMLGGLQARASAWALKATASFRRGLGEGGPISESQRNLIEKAALGLKVHTGRHPAECALCIEEGSREGIVFINDDSQNSKANANAVAKHTARSREEYFEEHSFRGFFGCRKMRRIYIHPHACCICFNMEKKRYNDDERLTVEEILNIAINRDLPLTWESLL